MSSKLFALQFVENISNVQIKQSARKNILVLNNRNIIKFGVLTFSYCYYRYVKLNIFASNL